jgi:hypothetical protein
MTSYDIYCFMYSIEIIADFQVVYSAFCGYKTV